MVGGPEAGAGTQPSLWPAQLAKAEALKPLLWLLQADSSPLQAVFCCLGTGA